MGPANGESKALQTVRFHYDRERLADAITEVYKDDSRAFKGLLVLLVVIVSVCVYVYLGLGGGWEESFGILMIVSTLSILIYTLAVVLNYGKGARDRLLKAVGQMDGLFIEVNKEGLRIPAGLADLEELRGNRTWLKKVVPIPLPEIRWVYVGIGPGMEKNLVINTKRSVRLFQTREFVVDVANLKEPVERLADALADRGVAVKVVWTAKNPYGYDFNGFRPVGKFKHEVLAVVDHEKGRTYDQRDREKIFHEEMETPAAP